MTELVGTHTSSAASRYQLLKMDRQHFIDRGAVCAKLTLPMLFQADVMSVRNMKIDDPAQSLGTRGVNAMASKTVVALFPTNTPFFKVNLDSVTDDPELDGDLKKEVETGLAKLERETLKDVENSGDITVANEALKHLLVVGNVGLFIGEKGTRLYNLNKYVVLRDHDGNVKEGIIAEDVIPDSLPKEFLNKLAEHNVAKKVGQTEKTLTLYTHIKIADGRVTWHQEVDGLKVGTVNDVPEEGNPWLFLRFSVVDGESYGRSHVEAYLGDLQSLEVLTKAINDGAVASAKVIFLVRPNGSTSAKVLADAPNMAVRTGNADDITILRLDKGSDMRVAKEMIEEISRRLAHAFMLRTEVMRDAERVTAEEVRIVARELDEANGGIYSILSKEFQLPYVKRRLFLLRKRAKIGKLPEGVNIAIVTGFAALGRAGEGDKLMLFLEKVTQLVANPAMGQKINVDEAIKRMAIADGIDLIGLLVPPETQAENSESAQGADLMKQMGPELIKQAGPAIMQQMQGQQPNDEEPIPPSP